MRKTYTLYILRTILHVLAWAGYSSSKKSIFAFHFRHVFFTLHAFLEFTEANKLMISSSLFKNKRFMLDEMIQRNATLDF